MAIVYANRVVEIALIHIYGGRPAVNVVHQRAVDETWPASPQQMAQDVVNNWQDHVLDLACDQLFFQRAEWRSLDPSDNSVGTIARDESKPIAGGKSGLPTPPNVAYLIKKNTEQRPRGRRDGRIFLAGVTEGDVDGAGNIATLAETAGNTSLAAYYNGVSDTGLATNNGHYPVVLETTPASRAPGSQSVTIGARRISSFTMDSRCSTQRDRLR